jgi:hypothetical protein
MLSKISNLLVISGDHDAKAFLNVFLQVLALGLFSEHVEVWDL